MNENVFTIGVAGYCPPSEYDRAEAERLVREALAEAVRLAPEGAEIRMAGGWSDTGIHGQAYHIAKYEYGWYVIGFGSQMIVLESEGGEYELFPVDEHHKVGTQWGDESDEFVAACDALVRIGGGVQSHNECEAMLKQGKHVITRELEKLN